MIAVCITTYNHAPYIAQCIESVLVQQCDEAIRVYIGDDASTDGTSDIVKDYAMRDKRINYILREKNIGLVKNTVDIYRRIMADKCEYIAMLDGDDYWTDEKKLQFEIDYLRKHPECGLVHTAAYDDVDGQTVLPPAQEIPTGDISMSYGLLGARQTNCTVVFRAELLTHVPLEELMAQQFPVLDYPLYGLFSQITSFGYLPTPTAGWRVHSSVSQPVSISAYSRYKRERMRMWKWLERQHPKKFHFSRLRGCIWYNKQMFGFFCKKFT